MELDSNYCDISYILQERGSVCWRPRSSFGARAWLFGVTCCLAAFPNCIFGGRHFTYSIDAMAGDDGVATNGSQTHFRLIIAKCQFERASTFGDSFS